jgi:hypothetical protein
MKSLSSRGARRRMPDGNDAFSFPSTDLIGRSWFQHADIWR